VSASSDLCARRRRRPDVSPLPPSFCPHLHTFSMDPGRRTRSKGGTDLVKHILHGRGGLDYHCKDCGQWISTYHNSHKQHFSACRRKLKEAKRIAKRIEKHGIHAKPGSRASVLSHNHLKPADGDLQFVPIPGDGIHPLLRSFVMPLS
jgi:hypothetical protein